MIRASGIAVSFGGRRALSGVELDVDRGERIGLLGPNGAGKTTLLRVLAGYLEPDSGALEIDGADAIADPRAAGRAIGYLPEGAPAYDDMRAIAYLTWRGRFKGLDRRAAIAAAGDALERVDLADRARSRIAALSAGMRKRLGLAEAMIADPALLVLDEPTTGLDPAQLRRLVAVVRDLAADRAMILSSHRLESVTALCDRLVVMASGGVVFDGTAASMIATARRAGGAAGDLEEAFLALTGGARGVEAGEDPNGDEEE